MAPELQFGGQCASCIEAQHCTFPRVSGRPVRNCEEFCPPRAECVESRRGPCETQLTSTGFTMAARSYKGLCGTCDVYDSCTFPRDERVPVTRCDEHR